MRIAEIFRSIQGEGRWTGTESVFVRASGCNLRCRWCDTPYASWTPEGGDFSIAEIQEKIEILRVPFPSSPRSPIPNHLSPSLDLVMTGGEPMMFGELVPLTAELRAAGWRITIETSGTLYLPVACDLMSISPKLSNSTPSAACEPHWVERHEARRHAPETIRRLVSEYDYQMKFVIGRPRDCQEVEQYLAEFPGIDRGRVFLMPEGVDLHSLESKTAWLEPYCARHGVRFCPRRHVEWFGVERGR
ncbi:MAG: 7-carboxy-7-deazaguanine synthase QueE [Planctomycetaceae bacterium]|nr:7-carboxy-7-deazaguanine synthase QueE [Planctomycetaceae bacterium]